MREFFNGWRRKAGCLLLVLSLFFATLWWRSYFIGDVWTLWHLNLLSCDERFSWAWFDRDMGSQLAFVNLRRDLPSWDQPVLCHYDDVFHYRMIAIPLTLLSACLILWNPRPKQ